MVTCSLRGASDGEAVRTRDVAASAAQMSVTSAIPSVRNQLSSLPVWLPVPLVCPLKPKTRLSLRRCCCLVPRELAVDAVGLGGLLAQTADAVALAICHGHSSGSQLSRLIAKANANDGAMGKILHKTYGE